MARSRYDFWYRRLLVTPRQWMFPAPAVALFLAAGCDDGTPAADLYGLPARSQAVDTSRVNDAFRVGGGDVFVTLTGRPGSEAMAALEEAGLTTPSGRDDGGPVSLAPLVPRAVLGFSSTAAVHDLAKLPFVTSIEPTVDPGGSGIE